MHSDVKHYRDPFGEQEGSRIEVGCGEWVSIFDTRTFTWVKNSVTCEECRGKLKLMRHYWKAGRLLCGETDQGSAYSNSLVDGIDCKQCLLEVDKILLKDRYTNTPTQGQIIEAYRALYAGEIAMERAGYHVEALQQMRYVVEADLSAGSRESLGLAENDIQE